jgi:hypothetical protein
MLKSTGDGSHRPPAFWKVKRMKAARFVGSGTCQRRRFFSAIFNKPIVTLSDKTAAVQAGSDRSGVTTLRPRARTATTPN